MPTYVYKNLNTGETFEIKQSIREDALTKHPETGEPIRRMIQPVGIAFKGSGFYVNDSKGASKGHTTSNTNTSTESTSSSSDSSSDTKDSSSDTKDTKAKDSGATKTGSSTSTTSSTKSSN